MLRTQISLTEADRALLDAEARRSGRSISALIRHAVEAVYAVDRPAAADLATMRDAFGSWDDREEDSTDYVERLRSGTRLER